jgi:cyclophilin family peptidyl-prolyl cis-trans isomerase
MKKLFLPLLVLALFSACGVKSSDQDASNAADTLSAAPAQAEPDTLKAGLDYQIEIETSFGLMKVRLFDETPKHRDNFIKLAQEGFFDGTLFHRVIREFMIQGGDPDSRNAPAGMALGNGGPGYTIPAEFVPNFLHKKGALAAARTGDAINPKKESSGSQFYIVQGRPYTNDELIPMAQQKKFSYTFEEMRMYRTLGGTPMLDRDYTVFGEVVYGLSVLDKIAAVETDGNDRPKADVTMKVRYISAESITP